MTENDRRLCEAYRTALKHWASNGIDGHEHEADLIQFASELASSWLDRRISPEEIRAAIA